MMAKPAKKDAKSKESTTQSKNRKTWSESEKEEALDYLLDTIRKGKSIEKPNASAYYLEAVKALNFADCTGSQLKHIIYNMKRKYVGAIDWRKNTGQGVLLEEGEQSVTAAIHKMCPFFEKLDEIFGTRASIIPPLLHDSINLNEVDLSGINSSQHHDGVASQSANDECPSVNTAHEKNPDKPAGKVKKRNASESGLETLATAAKFRFEIQKDELSLQREKWIEEKTLRGAENQLLREKFEFEKVMAEQQLALAEKRVANQLLLEEKRAENEFILAKYKIDKEMELEFAKIK